MLTYRYFQEEKTLTNKEKLLIKINHFKSSIKKIFGDPDEPDSMHPALATVFHFVYTLIKLISITVFIYFFVFFSWKISDFLINLTWVGADSDATLVKIMLIAAFWFIIGLFVIRIMYVYDIYQDKYTRYFRDKKRKELQKEKENVSTIILQ